MLFDILKFSNNESSNCTVVGDTTFDMDMAKSAGMDGAAVGLWIPRIGNSCLHIITNALIPEASWVGSQGNFLTMQGKYLVCSTHGAVFDPQTGKCLSGPCVKQSLISIPVKSDGGVVLIKYEF